LVFSHSFDGPDLYGPVVGGAASQFIVRPVSKPAGIRTGCRRDGKRALLAALPPRPVLP
jgi:hypothetical protein